MMIVALTTKDTYVVTGLVELSAKSWDHMMSKYTGTGDSVGRILKVDEGLLFSDYYLS